MPLVLSKNNVSLGKVRVNQPQTILVNIINNSNEEVKITEVKPSCGPCTRAMVNSYTIPAKGQVQMTVIFTPNSTSQVPVNKSVKINGQIIFSFNALVVN